MVLRADFNISVGLNDADFTRQRIPDKQSSKERRRKKQRTKMEPKAGINLITVNLEKMELKAEINLITVDLKERRSRDPPPPPPKKKINRKRGKLSVYLKNLNSKKPTDIKTVRQKALKPTKMI